MRAALHAEKERVLLTSNDAGLPVGHIGAGGSDGDQAGEDTVGNLIRVQGRSSDSQLCTVKGIE